MKKMKKMKKIVNEDDQYIDKDFWRSALLLENKIPLLGIKWQGPVAFFIFGNRSRCEEIAEQYLLGSIDTNARSYVDCLNRLKSVMRSSQPGLTPPPINGINQGITRE
jgi:hypothetical protein